jgi:hypothetical protein
MKALVALIAVLSSCSTLWAAEQSIHVEWGYTPPSSPPVTGYQLYNEGVKACLWSGATVTSGDCTVNLVKDATPFTLAAVFSDGTESAQSATYTFDRTLDVRPVLKSITIN